MSSRTAKETDNLIWEKLPGYKLSPGSSKVTGGAPVPAADAPGRPRQRRRADSATPSIDDLRRKFLRSDAGDDATEEGEGQDADIVLVEPEVETGGRRQRKAVVISASGKVLGAQG